MSDFYYTIEKASVAEYKDRGSRFLAYAFPIQKIEDFKASLKKLKEEHPKAAHHCFAYRIGTDGNNFRANDDGEPSGSAGKPILGQIDSKSLTNTSIVVVRYFGGTLLGVPGLINAYKTVASLCLQLTPIIKKPILDTYSVEFDYTLLNDIMLVIKRFECVILENESHLFCRMVIGIPRSNTDNCLEKLAEMYQVAVRRS